MVDPSSVRLVGALAPYRDGLWAELLALGYTPLSGASLVRVMSGLSRWLEGKGLEPKELDSRRIGEFLEHRRASGRTCWLSLQGLDPILQHLRRVGAVPPAEPRVAESTPLAVLLDEYSEYLLRERGLKPSTATDYVYRARQLISALFGAGELAFDGLNASDVTSLILQVTRSSSVHSAKSKVRALRSLLRYLLLRGDVTNDLVAAVPSVSGRRLAGLPKGLESADIRKLLSSCDRRTHVGRRDFAVLVLMVRLGLRAREVTTLGLDDLDWVRGELFIRGKQRREDRLPLPHDIGEAIASYLKRGRPRSTSRQVFLRLRAPHRGLSYPSIRRIVVLAGERSGLGSLTPHRLRHTAATQMLRNGASLSQVGQVLRHQGIDTTAIYAKVDQGRLGQLARPWPGGKR